MDVNKFSLYHEPTTLFSEIKYDTYMYILLENGGCMGFRICVYFRGQRLQFQFAISCFDGSFHYFYNQEFNLNHFVPFPVFFLLQQILQKIGKHLQGVSGRFQEIFVHFSKRNFILRMVQYNPLSANPTNSGRIV